MQKPLLVRRKRRTPWLSIIVLLGLFSGVQIATREQHPQAAADTQHLQPITVTRDNGAEPAAGGGLSFADAIRQAGQDPRDNLIRFDPQVFGAGSGTIILTNPICVQAESAGHDRIDGSLPTGNLTLDASGCPDAGVMVSGSAKLTISNLTLRGGRLRGILVRDHGEVNLDRVAIRDSKGPGLAAFNHSRSSLKGCQFTANRTHGIELRDQASSEVQDGRFAQHGQSDLAVFDRAMVTAERCRMQSTGDWNLVLNGETQGRLTGCVLSQARFANVDASKSARLWLTGCSLEDGRRTGVFATGQAVIDLTDTRLLRHANRGIELQEDAAITIEGSTMEFCGEYGLVLFGRSSVHATQMRVANSGSHGVCLRNKARGWFDRCVFDGNRHSGIACPDAADGGPVRVTCCQFGRNGMRPIYRGPLHLDPLVPTPVRIDGPQVTCMAEANATIELFLDRAGEAGRYLKTATADHLGRFTVDCRDVPQGYVMTATATAGESTSEFNVIAGGNEASILSALLGNTGPLSDEAGQVQADSLLRRWQTGTRLVLNVVNPPNPAVERYTRFLVDRINEWTDGTVKVELRIGPMPKAMNQSVVVPIRYVSADSPKLVGRGGATFMKWDAAGTFLPPMEIMLALGQDPSQACPRVLAHEIGHTLGLCHARVGLLSRMQGITPPESGYVNDFAPMMTYYDVLALQTLHNRGNTGRLTLQQLVQGLDSIPSAGTVAKGQPTPKPAFAPEMPAPDEANPAHRP